MSEKKYHDTEHTLLMDTCAVIVIPIICEN